jgi:radical SAM protein with 4Fe4S-binding SPASM domain
MFIARNIREQSLAEIWNKSRVFLGIRKFWMETKNFCGCKYFEICKGRCLAQRYYSYGRMDGGARSNMSKKFTPNLNKKFS